LLCLGWEWKLLLAEQSLSLSLSSGKLLFLFLSVLVKMWYVCIISLHIKHANAIMPFGAVQQIVRSTFICWLGANCIWILLGSIDAFSTA